MFGRCLSETRKTSPKHHTEEFYFRSSILNSRRVVISCQQLASIFVQKTVMSTDSNSTLARVWNMFSSAVARWEDFFIFCGFGVQWTNVRIERTTIDQMSEGKGKGSRAQLNYSLFRRERVWKKKPQNTTGCPHLLVDWAGSTWIQCVPLSAQFCLGWWELGRSGWENGQTKVNQTQVHD